MNRIILQISGMTCGHCLHAVNEALSSQPGIQLESLRMGRAVLRYDDRVTSPDSIERLVTAAGYSAVATPSETHEAEEPA